MPDVSGLIPPKPIVVTICGGSGAGKSKLAQAIVRRLGDLQAARVPVDWYIEPRPPGMSIEEFKCLPVSFDWDILRRDLHHPVGTRIEPPNLDFTTFRRAPGLSGHQVVIRPLMLLDGMQPYPDADVVVLLDVSEDERYRRVKERDQEWGTTVHDRWSQVERTFRPDLVQPDYVLNNTGTVEATAEELIAWLGRKGFRREIM